MCRMEDSDFLPSSVVEMLPAGAGQRLCLKPKENQTKGYLCLKCQCGSLFFFFEQVKARLSYLSSFHVAACLLRPPAASGVNISPFEWIMFIYITVFRRTSDLAHVWLSMCVRASPPSLLRPCALQ